MTNSTSRRREDRHTPITDRPNRGPRTIGQTRDSNIAPYGECTWYAYHRFRLFSGQYPALQGHAAAWPGSAQRAGWEVTLVPEPNAIVITPPGMHGAHPVYGHAGWVTSVNPRSPASVSVTEMNGPAGHGRVTTRHLPHSPGMAYILAPERPHRRRLPQITQWETHHHKGPSVGDG